MLTDGRYNYINIDFVFKDVAMMIYSIHIYACIQQTSPSSNNT